MPPHNSLADRASDPKVISLDVRADLAIKTVDSNNWISPAMPKVVSQTVLGDAPGVMTIRITTPVVRARSFDFSDADETPAHFAADAEISRQNRVIPAPVQKHPSGLTRIRPPGDVIKTEDRLHYLLQPSLESLLCQGELGFPNPPFSYQLKGMAFLYPRHAAILADEMGLGKTMQAITAVRLLLRRHEVRRVLLVCPKPLVSNWCGEFRVWAPELPVMVVEGDQAKREWQWRLPDVPLRIANYEILVRDSEIIDNELREKFDLVLLDESQRIKNRLSATNRAVCSVPRKRSWALTGTPVENSADDLVGIFEFLSPGFLSPDMKPKKMGRVISDFVLRRTKEHVLADLPPKIVHDEQLELSPEQRATYDLAEEQGVLRLTEMGASATIRHVFELILRLKQICNFDTATGTSVKLERLQADLEEIAQSGRKAIVFSQWVTAIQKLSAHLAQFGTLEYHGRIPAHRRDKIIEQFRADESKHVLLISYGAGGVGLNLQAANYVFLFDRWWNPAVEDQAINRAHRIGIDQPVHVTRFLTLNTIEERIEMILQEKRDLFDTIFSGAATHQKMGLTQEELFGLFQIKCPAVPSGKAA